jgi:AmmeMemoRadiSam system protein B/AmmeMemoRadiSam system protein A
MRPVTCNRIVLIVLILAALLSACAAATLSVEPTSTATSQISALPSPTSAAQVPNPTIPADKIRPSVIAGSWYPDDPEALREMVDTMLDAAKPVDGAPVALIVPHAGYVYSGPVAAYGFKQLEEGDYEVAVIIASDHQAPLSDPISVWVEGGFETPLGVVPVDAEIASALVAAHPDISNNPASHAGEHPIEIELPFLQRVCPGCRIVPILMGSDDEDSVLALSDALLSVLPGKKAVLIASSDLSHYPSYQNAVQIDGATLAAVETGDPAQVRAVTSEVMAMGYPNLATCACGRGPILVAMQVAQGLGADTTDVLLYANSGDSPYGNQDQVVGYGAVMIWRYDPPELTETQRQELLGLARSTLGTYLQDGEIPPYDSDDPILTRRSGAFVTLRVDDPSAEPDASLRGCIGHLRADIPLYQVVQQMAVQAATMDPRFPPLTIEELDEITIEISILSPFQRVTDLEEIQLGTHGLQVYKDGQTGLLLPQVPVEQGWNREAFYQNLCLKANLDAGCWKEGASIYSFTAVVFGEDE